jgi:hypothetical protein
MCGKRNVDYLEGHRQYAARLRITVGERGRRLTACTACDP